MPILKLVGPLGGKFDPFSVTINLTLKTVLILKSQKSNSAQSEL